MLLRHILFAERISHAARDGFSFLCFQCVITDPVGSLDTMVAEEAPRATLRTNGDCFTEPFSSLLA